MKKIFLILLAISLMGTLVFGGCNGTDEPVDDTPIDDTPIDDTPVEPDKYGGTLKILSASGSPSNFSNLAGSFNPTDNRYAAPAGETLMGKDGDGNFYPLLATDWEVAEDGSYLTFYLREGVKFHDGTDFNADAAKFCLDMAINGVMPELPTMLTSVDVIDEYTIQLNVPQFDWGLLDTLAMSPVCMMVSPASLQDNPEEWGHSHIVGTGPFKLVEYTTDVSIVYERFDDYWQEDKPYLDGVEFELMADYTTSLLAFQAGSAQVMYAVDAKDVASLEQAGFTVEVGPQGNTYTFFFDSANPDSPFSDVKVRQAFCHAIDTDDLLELGYGLFTATNQPYAPGFWPNNPDVVGYPYNVQKAKDLLAETDYPDGFETTINMITGRPEDLQLSMQSYLAEVGIDLQINKITAPQFVEMYVFNGWEGLCQIYSGTWPRCPSLVERGATVNIGDFGAKSSADFPELIDLFLDANSTIDFDEAKAKYYELWKLMVDTYCTHFFAYYVPDISAYTTDVHDLGLSCPWFTLADCYLAE